MKIETPNSQQCVDPEEIIDNCRVYNGESCQKCNPGFRLTLESTCEEMVGVDDLQADACLLYTDYECNGCGQSVLYENSVIPSLFEPGKNPELTLFEYSLRSVDGYPNLSYCYEESFVENCDKFSSPFTCDQCIEGFYLDSNGINCHTNPQSPKASCIFYEDATLEVCTECEQNHQLSNNECTVIVQGTIENCVNYTGSKGEPVHCSLCDGQRFYNGNVCTDYVNNTNCATFDPIADKCTSCTGGALSVNGVCLDTIIENCKDYNDDNTCKVCEDYHLIVDEECVEQEGDCQCWDNETSECLMCNSDSLYLSEVDVCSDRDYIIRNCNVYSKDQKSYCDQCAPKTLFINSSLACQASSSVENCNRYSDAQTCSLCDDNFRLDTNNNTCSEITDDICINYVDDICKSCTDGYKLNKTLNVCVEKIDREQCENIEQFGYIQYCDDCEGIKVSGRHKNTVCVDQIDSIEGCEVYNSQGCKKCDMGYVIEEVNGINVCVYGQTCEFGILYSEKQGARCVTEDESIAGCYVHSYSLQNLDSQSLVCIECSPIYVPVKTCSTDYALDSCFVSSKQIDSFFPHYQCILREDTDMLPRRRPVNPDDFEQFLSDIRDGQVSQTQWLRQLEDMKDLCAYYELAEDGQTFKCQQCIFGYNGAIIETDRMAYVECTTTVQDCDTSIVKGALTSMQSYQNDLFNGTIPYLYSCHHCTEGIPFIHKAVSGELCSYNLSQEIPSNGEGGNLIECRDPANPDHFGGETIDFVDNCALGYLIVDSPLQNQTNYPSAACVACKSGFSPQVDQQTGLITDCVLIDTCGEGQNLRLNSCSSCPEGFALTINDGFVIGDCHELGNEYSNGIQYVVLGEGDEIVSTVCAKDHIQISDKECRPINRENCEGILFYDSEKTNIDNSRIADCALLFELYYNTRLQGCQKCGNDKSLLEGNFCFDIQHDTDCVQYDQDMECVLCPEGFIVNQNDNSCINGNDHIGCAVYGYNGNLNEESCVECKKGLSFVEDVCTVENCDNFINDQQCDTCSDGYTLLGDICVEERIQIENCWKVGDDDTCEECFWGYFQAGGKCFQLTQQASQTVNTFNLQEFETFHTKTNLDCKGGFKKSQLFDNNCEFITDIQNCKEFNYEIESFANIDRIQCVECESGYLENGTCLPYTPVENCSEYSLTSDKCEKCIADFAIDKEKNECIRLILGISECVIYDGATNANTCKRCNSGYYVNQSTGACSRNSDPDNNNDETCLWYSADNVCGQCVEDHQFGDDGQCEGDGPANCLSWDVYNGSKVCTECKDGFVEVSRFDDSNLVIECKGPEEGSNCLYLNSSGTKCAQCVSGYALLNQGSDNIICIEVTEPEEIIDNCDLYGEFVFNVTTRKVDINCNRCNKGTVKIDIAEPTDQRQTECKQLDTKLRVQQNCYLYHNPSSEKCKLCKDGYFLSSGKCNRCGDFENCAICDPIESNICYVCKPGKDCWTETQQLKDSNKSGSASLSLMVFYTIMALFF